MKKNIKNITTLDKELGTQVTSLNGDITDLGRQLNTTTDDLNGAVINFDRKNEKLNRLIEDLMEFNNNFGGYKYAFIETEAT